MIDQPEVKGKFKWAWALGFAQAAHIAQKRKYTGEPYINHCVEVADILSLYIPDSDIIVAGLLHDILEDTAITEAQLREVFDDRITDMVLCVTDVSKPTDGNRVLRKALDLEHLKNCSDDAANIKYADLISNSRSIVEHDRNFAAIYLPEKRKILEALAPKGNGKLREFAYLTLKQAQLQLEE